MGPSLRVVSLVSSVILALAQRTSPLLPPDPATDLVRVRVFLTTASAALDVTIDGARPANAVLTVRAGLPNARVDIDRSTIRLTQLTAGVTADVQIDLLLTEVPAGSSVGWTVSASSRTTATLDIRNANDGLTAVDRFDLDAVSARFTTASDRLRQGGPLTPVRPINSRLVLAFFYPWWNLDSWSSPLFLDEPQQRYSTSDPGNLVRVMAQAQAAGLDGLLVSWTGRDFDGGIEHRRMLACLDAAQAAGMRVAPLFETTRANPQQQDGVADPNTVFQWLMDIAESYASHPAYLRVGGRPVVVAYAAQRMSQAGWADALGRFRATGRDVLFVGEGINATRLGALDGLFYYPSNEFQGNAIREFDRFQSASVRTYHLLSGPRRVWMATVSPGYDDTRLAADGRTTRVTDREAGAYYDRQWQSAIDMRADWVVVTSWNEWFENTQIEPSVRYGDLYLRKTRTWADTFRGDRAMPRR